MKRRTTDTPERALLRRLVEASDHIYDVVLYGPQRGFAATEHWVSVVKDARALLAEPEGEGATARYERLAEEFYHDTGLMAPGKDVSAAMGSADNDERRAAAWKHWIASRASTPRSRAEAEAMPDRDALDEAQVLSPEQFVRLLRHYRSGRGGEYDAAGDALIAHDAAVRRLVEQGEEFVVMRVDGVEDANDPYGQRYIKSMLVISSDLSGDQGREFRITDGDRVRVTRLPGREG